MVVAGQIAPELVERMVAHLRHCAAAFPRRPLRDELAQANWDELHAIAARLPAPVEPDIEIAREIVAAQIQGDRAKDVILAGNWDSGTTMSVALAALKRGRELAVSGQ